MNRNFSARLRLAGPATLPVLAGAAALVLLSLPRPVRGASPVETRRIPVDGQWREFVRLPGAAGEGADTWLLYPEGYAGDPGKSRRLRGRAALRLTVPSLEAATGTAADHGLTVLGPAAGTGEHSGWWIFEAPSAPALAARADSLMADPRIASVHFLLYRQMTRRLIPNDSFFGNQWHLLNTGQSGGTAGADVNVTPVWDSFRGTGQRIAIVDDGLEVTHPDLAPNVDTVNDHNWNAGSPDDPSPDPAYDVHGTASAGVAAARGNNGMGVSGSAPEATLVGLRLIAGEASDAEEAEALAWLPQLIGIYSNSWGPEDDARTLEGPGPLTRAALANSTATGRGGKGSIHVWAAGNGGNAGDDSNKDGYANSIHTIAVGAITNGGTAASYSEAGANLVIVTPSAGGTLDIATTDLTGGDGYNYDGNWNLADNNYTSDFGGTSAACPLAAGCIALLLQSNPGLGWRDVQEILIRSAAQNDPGDPEWITNGAGWHFHHRFGAGLLNAQAAVALANGWTALPAATTTGASENALLLSIPDNNTSGISRSFTIPAGSNLRTEHVTLTPDIQHSSRGHLSITLTSPSGTVSRLAVRHSDTGDHYQGWTFSTIRCWGEDAAGTWTLRIADTTSGTTGTYRGATLTIHGTPAGPVNQPPVVTGGVISPEGPVYTDMTLTLAGTAASDPEGDAITLSRQWQSSADGLVWTDIAGATGPELEPGPSLSGHEVRCRLTPMAAGKTGAAWLTPPVAVNRRPVQFARRGSAYSYDSDLFLPAAAAALTRDVIIHEFSQGPTGGTSEWIELLVVKTADLRGWRLGDRTSTFATFASSSFWSSVPAGTLVVVYRAGPALDSDPAGFNLSLPYNNTTWFVPGNWSALSNTSPEAVVLTRADNSIADGVSFNGDTVHLPRLESVASGRAARFIGGMDSEADSAASWEVIAQGTATPGAPNGVSGSANGDFIGKLRTNGFDASGRFRFAQPPGAPAGLQIQESTGLISGTVDLPAGIHQVVLEKYDSSGGLATQSWPLHVYDPAKPEADEDGDGLGTLLETALGLDPFTPSLPPAPVSWPDGSWQWTLDLPGSYTTPGHPAYSFEYSTGLDAWLPAGGATVESNLLTAPDTRRLVLRHTIPGNPARAFIRLRATLPAP